MSHQMLVADKPLSAVANVLPSLSIEFHRRNIRDFIADIDSDARLHSR